MPRYLPGIDGEILQHRDDSVWRCYPYHAGTVVNEIDRESVAAAAGTGLARVHAALNTDSCLAKLAPSRAHDTPSHLARLQATLTEFASHPRFSLIAPLAEDILDVGARLKPLGPLPPRAVHGDPKISNFLFDLDMPRTIGILDLDTPAVMALPLELGDAMRSWCNPRGEDLVATTFRVDLFAAALGGYVAAAPAWLTAAELLAVAPATQRIALELASRFCRDALAEDYFGWNPRDFSSHSEHSEVRARGQLQLCQEVGGRYAEAVACSENLAGVLSRRA